MEALNSLSMPIRKYIFDSNWEELSRIQAASLHHVQKTNANLILAAPTASGKTEAAFLPSINDIQDWSTGLKIIYISPLIALINDQFKRVTELCKYLDVKVTSWHGEASQTLKKKLLTKPEGILLITPESIEAMLSVNPQNARQLFTGVEWVIVDEIHNFIGENRGIQLQSLLERMEAYTKNQPRYIGMSATLNQKDYEQSKDFFPNGRETLVLLDKNKNKLKTTIEYHPSNIKGVSKKAVQSIFKLSQNQSMLVFPNSRETVEELTYNINEYAKKNKSHTNYFAHHASTSKNHRTMVEDFAKKSNGELFTIFCTSTLELGIDIGRVDSVVQFGAPYSVSSLAQRLGRSGRRTKESVLNFIGTHEWDLLQGLAAIQMYQRGEIDQQGEIVKPYDVLAHQMISLLLEYPEIKLTEFSDLINKKRIAKDMTKTELNLLINELIKENYIEIDPPYIFVGTESEKLLRGYEFYGMFIENKMFRVVDENRNIGQISVSPSAKEGNNILLAGKVWTIQKIEVDTNKVFVRPAKKGTAPDFYGSGGKVSDLIRIEMKRILLNPKAWDNYDSEVRKTLKILSKKVSGANKFDYVVEEDGLVLYPFRGTEVVNTLGLMLEMVAKDTVTIGIGGSIQIQDIRDNINKLKSSSVTESELRSYLMQRPDKIKVGLSNVKYGQLLPNALKVEYILNNILDLAGAEQYLKDHT
ncbi:DEAD/DEAH box helicase [Aerococcaceae bacterium DSM 111176]|nr:DEAD/DEAH box helicase [Aerococcaceae bacterium DSM 111176]